MSFIIDFIFKVSYFRTHILPLLSVGSKDGLKHYSTFQTFLLQFAAIFIRFGNVAIDKVGIGVAATAAEKSGPAGAAFCFGHNMSMSEFLYQIRFNDTGCQRTQFIFFPSYELVAG